MRVINPKCSDHTSVLSSIVISLHFYDLLPHPERYSKIKKYTSNYGICGESSDGFEYCNPAISLTVYDENGQIINKPTNDTNKKAFIVKINNHRYNALKPKLTKEMKLKTILSQFTHEELNNFILNKISK